MKATQRIVIAALVSLCAARAIFAADPPPQAISGTPGQATSSAVINFSELAKQESAQPAMTRGAAPMMRLFKNQGTAAPAAEPIEPHIRPKLASPGTSVDFQALLDNTTIIPPDTMGAVGPNHVMTTLNSQVRIQDKTGNILSTVSLNSFWAPVGGSPGCFDPKLTYDPFNNRWIFAAAADAQLATSSALVGVSSNSDPTGLWFLYKVDADPTDVSWADFPSVGFNKDWIVVTYNMFPNSGPGFNGVNLYVFNKTNLYAHGAGTFTLLQDTSGNGFTLAPALTYSNSLATEFLLENWNPGAGQLRLSTITGAVGAEVLTLGTAFPASTAWDGGGFGDFLPQLGTTRKIDGGDARMGSVTFRNGSLWTSQTAFLPAGAPTRTAAQWWQIATNGTVLQRGRIDDANGILFYAYPSIAVNGNNDVLLGYSRFATNQYASGNYSFRFAADTANTLRDDTVLKAGQGAYIKTFGGPDNRWGDYSSTVVDPANDNTLWTLQEYAATPVGDPTVNENNSRWGTWWGRIDTGIFVLLSNATITSEACGNGVIDPNETVTVNFTLQNGGGVATTNLTATLLATNGVTAPTGPQNYGAITSGGTATRAFTFTATGACGGTLAATLQLQDGALNLGTVTISFPLGLAVAPLSQNFDGVTPPALPSGWTASNAVPPGATWTTSTAASDSGANSAFVPDHGFVSDNRLSSPVFPIATSTAVLTFRHNYNLENADATTAYDGGVLEISTNGGAFTDILAAGGSFALNGYTHTVDPGFSNPLANRQAWSGSSGGFITTIVNLPASAAGKNVQLRWRCGTDTDFGLTGWFVDSISINDGFSCCVSYVQPTIVNPQLSGTNLLFSFLSTSGQTYTVQYKDSLTITGWQSLLSLTGNASLKTITNGATGTTRFFRVRSP